jgi:site-specific DNA-methyltransferase (adenine-specific)
LKLINNDCIAAMKEMPDNLVDSIVTDPPYELGFMGKSWDSSGIAFNVDVWQEALRVLKPGGHLIAFSGSRTYHRMAVAIEDAGFEIRDQIMWVYGSGFPKSHNVSKGIDKAAGAEREVVGERKQRANFINSLVPMNASVDEVKYITAPSTPQAQQWDGWGTALKPAHEPMVLARKPFIGTVANNVLTFGTGGLNIDGSRVGSEGGTKIADKDLAESSASKTVTAYGDGLGGPKAKPVENLGRWPANFIHDGSDEVVALFPDTKSGAIKPYVRNKESVNVDFLQGTEQVEKSFDYADSGSAARFFYCAKASKRDRNEGLDGFAPKKQDESRKEGNVGGDNPRNRGVHERVNHHPTVKPTDLMRYLVRLVTPPNGTVLDPFMGSGSTGKACAYEGFDFIGIDESAEYVEIARARIKYAQKQGEDYLL